MGSDAPPRRPDEELAVLDDADFGAMRLMRQWNHFKAPGGGGWTEMHIDGWHGVLSGAELVVSAEGEEAAPQLTAQTRTALRDLGANLAAFKRDIAERMLDLAGEWAESGDLPAPNLDALDAALTLNGVRVDPAHEIFIYFEESGPEDATIFAGHVIEVRCELDGTVKEAHLAG